MPPLSHHTASHHTAHPAAALDLARTVWPAVPPRPVVLVPIGSTEQHGPHLPFDTDSVIARAVAEGAARVLPGEPLVAPPLPYGASGEHAHFPGTVSIGQEALCSVIVELVRSLSLWAESVVLVNGHGGNAVPLGIAVPRMRAEGHDVAWTGCGVPGGDAHAGRTETSVMLHLTPQDVRLDLAVAGDTRPIATLMPDLIAHGVRAISPTGVLGDPTGATAEEGRGLMDLMVSLTARRVIAGVADSRGHLVDPDEPAGCADGAVVPRRPESEAAH
ncbi:mycofactocin biosynthesis peptidyl-dipeptidase MftE [Streptomyces sp. NPDC020802]|uniref:mycofactocin biosynthesis peptidyl-dipeptidase MftE n=1 Tax=Streptomyces sp. NPDC020802 TaxID=3365094 RepID=UPI0037942D2D